MTFVLIVCGSLDNNQICGVNRFGDGTYTAEGINKLAEAIKASTALTTVAQRLLLSGLLDPRISLVGCCYTDACMARTVRYM